MCTVTIVPYDDGFRLMCNRDERRDRPVAIPPIDRRLPHRTAIYPQDPLGGGTWVGVNDAGLAAALLNRSVNAAAPGGARPLRSRGLIIPPLLDASSVTEAADIAADLDPALFNPFRVVVLQRMVAWLLTSDGVTLSVEAPDVTRPLMLTSSSLGDALVFRAPSPAVRAVGDATRQLLAAGPGRFPRSPVAVPSGDQRPDGTRRRTNREPDDRRCHLAGDRARLPPA